ncbi:MAG: DUF885 domain-containing protein [Halieaceae bacterium]|nr:DUF885 domain-containing protein [Halieaceae bacterium]
MLKRIFKWIGALVGAGVVVVAVLAINAIWFKPFFINVFFERVFIELALDDPELLTTLRVLEPLGIDGHNARLTDVSPAVTLKQNEKILRDAATLRRYDRESLSGQAALSYDVLDDFLVGLVDGIPYSWHGYPVNQLFGVQNNLPELMVTRHPLDTAQGAEYYIARLGQFDTKFDQLIEDLKMRESKGVIPPRFVVEKVLKEMRDFIAVPAQENILYTHFTETVAALEELPDERAADLAAEALSAMEGSVYPAYRELIGYFEALQSVATTNHGVWALPDGDAYYDLRLRVSTTTDLSAEEIHALGLEEVARIQSEMDAILREQGYTEGTVAERMTALGEEPRFLYPNTDAGREQILEDFQVIIDEIDEAMPDWFITLPKSPVEVLRIPEFRQEGAASASYTLPALDGSRPGRFNVNLRNLREHPRFRMRTLAYHEAVPGHHLQSALQTELTGVPQFRRVLPFTAFSEGWGLYAERLAWEAGFQDDPFDNLGRLQDELFRAVRLVVDTGIHRMRWTREEAITYMVDNSGLAETDVVTEIERYFVLPGQATAYKIGMIKILELRERARGALGEDFDIRMFHEVVLRNGDVPLTILEREVDSWISEVRSGSA